MIFDENKQIGLIFLNLFLIQTSVLWSAFKMCPTSKMAACLDFLRTNVQIFAHLAEKCGFIGSVPPMVYLQ
jgi:hypothetical protein